VTVQLLLLALATTVRPTSSAAVYALLKGSAPRRYLTVYLLAGVAFTVTFGLVVYAWSHGIATGGGTARWRAVAEIAGGVIALAAAVLVLTGRITPRTGKAQPDAPNRWLRLLDEHVTVGRAALAGPATHIPGLLYLLALDIIITEQPRIQQGLVDVLFFNAVWFAVPIAALAISIASPGSAIRTVEFAERWILRHARTVLVSVLCLVGIALLIHGLLSL
jgi:hypothetical protein